MKKFTLFTTAVLILLLACSALPAGALSFVPPYETGDVDMSSYVTVKDATLIQKYVAKSAELTEGQVYIADTDNDTFVTVKDATAVQKYCAKLLENFGEYKYFYDYMFPEALNPSIASGLATPDEEVTFYAKGTSFNIGEITYEFSVNDEVKQSRSTNDEFTCSFPEAGTHIVCVTMFDALGNTRLCTTRYIVTESRKTDSLYIKNFFYSSNLSDLFSLNTTFTAFAGGGSGNYQYKFLLNDTVIKDYSEDNFCKAPDNMDFGTNVFVVTVKDTDTNEEVSAELSLDVNLFF